MMEGLDGMLLACRASILLDRREAGEPTGIEEVVTIEEAAPSRRLPNHGVSGPHGRSRWGCVRSRAGVGKRSPF